MAFLVTSASRQIAERQSASFRVLTILTASLIVALTAHFSFPLPFTPIPFTLQPLAVLLAGLLLGPVDGFFALVAYVVEGAIGLPVFSPLGPGGLLQLFGPTGGYLMADPIVALTAGAVARQSAPALGRYWAAVLGGMLATAVLFMCGAGWIEHLHIASGRGLWMAAVIPFLPGEAVKIGVAAGVFHRFHSILSR